MTNAEFYKEEIKNIKNYSDDNFCEDFIQPKVLNSNECQTITCARCHTLVALWLQEEYKEDEIDWENVPVDTPILVKFSEGDGWYYRHFARLSSRGEVCAWNDGTTSFTNDGMGITTWNYAKLWEGSEEQAAERNC